MPVKHQPTFNSWRKMRERCSNSNADQYKWYGAKGVFVCDRWQNSYEAFVADMGERPDGKTIDRLDPDGPYEPANCRWATKREQIWNQAKTIKVEYQGETIALSDACERAGQPVSRVYPRVRRGLSFSVACSPEHLRETKTDERLREYVELGSRGSPSVT